MATNSATNVSLQSELLRSAAEASKIVIEPIQIERYLAPPVDTAFPLEYSFHLLGNLLGKTVLDLGCGSGEEVVPLIHRGANVIGIDLSPELIEIAQQRLQRDRLRACVRTGSAYDTQLPGSSVDVIFCMSLIHHLDVELAKKEMLRILRPGGFVVLKEPIRFSSTYGELRSLLPAREDISEDEHPLTRSEFESFQSGFRSVGLRYFRLPFVPLLMRVAPKPWLWKLDARLLAKLPRLQRWATSVVVKLERK
jgi:SAM-dependent methyltransferase